MSPRRHGDAHGKIEPGVIHMKKSKYSESQIVNILKEAEAGVSLEELSRQHGFSRASFYKWKAKYSGMSVSDLKRLKELEEENRRLKQMYANLSLDYQVLKDIVEKKL
jgi:putative transposase